MAENTLYNNRFQILAKESDSLIFSVYSAVDKIGDRQVSLYVMKPCWAEDRAFAEGYAKGAEECAQLDHPATLALLETDLENAEPFFVYEPVRGKSLAELLAGEKKLSCVKASEIIVNVLATLDKAHIAGLCHGDLTDDDVLITEDGSVKVRGFGRRDGLAASPRAKETLDKYTIYFQSPELIQGGLPAEQSDIYAAGAVYYRMLTGHVPFTGATSIETASRILETEPADPRSYDHEIPENISALVKRSLAKRPEDRIETASIYSQKISNCIKTGRAEGGFAEPKPSVGVEHPRETKGSGGMLGGVLLILAVLLLSACVTFYLVSRGKQVVPDVIGMSESEAVNTLEREGFFVLRNDPTYSEEFKEGLVIHQTPGAGRKLKKGETVTIQASLGNEFVIMPDVVGKHKGDAAEMIVRAGLKVNGVTGQYSDTVPEDYVISSNPEAALSVSKDTGVDLVVSNGIDIAHRFDREEPETEPYRREAPEPSGDDGEGPEDQGPELLPDSDHEIDILIE